MSDPARDAFERGFLLGREHEQLFQRVAARCAPGLVAANDPRHDATIAAIIAAMPRPNIKHQPGREWPQTAEA